VRGLDDFNPFAGSRVSVTGDDQALARAVNCLQRFAHARAGFACANDDEATFGFGWQMFCKAQHRVGTRYGCLEKRGEKGAWIAYHASHVR
jgi:hypothetical protein